MSGDSFRETSKKLRFWSLVAPAVLIALCITIGVREGFSAVWGSSTIQGILLIAALIFLSMRLVAYFLEMVAGSEHRKDDGE